MDDLVVVVLPLVDTRRRPRWLHHVEVDDLVVVEGDDLAGHRRIVGVGVVEEGVTERQRGGEIEGLLVHAVRAVDGGVEEGDGGLECALRRT